MNIEIEYCGMWNYLPEAARVAAELSDAVSVTSKLIEGGKGIFDVKVDGRLVYSKYETNRFPQEGEIAQLVQAT